MFDLILNRYPKGTITEFSNFQKLPQDKIESLISGSMFSSRSVICNWLESRTESIKRYHENVQDNQTGAEEQIFYPVKKEEFLEMVKEGRDVLAQKEAVDKAVDEAIGDRTLFGRSEMGWPRIYPATTEIMKRFPESWRVHPSDWIIPRMRDFWWIYWDQMTKALEALGNLEKEIDWGKEDLFFFLN